MFIIDAKGFVWFNGVKLPVKLVVVGSCANLEFCIKDPRIAEIHGGRFVRVPVASLSTLTEKQEVEP
jgi:hypothetical protein